MQTSAAHSSPNYQNSENLFDKAQRLKYKHNYEEIKDKLLKENNYTEEEIDAVLKQLKAIQHEKDHKTGRMLILIGAALLLAGFVLTFLNIYTNQSVHLAMYGLTSAGLLTMFIGLYYVFN